MGVDMDMGMRNADLYLGMENRVVFNIMDVLSGVCRISKATIKVDGFDTLFFMAAAPRKDDRDITPLHVEVLCEKLKNIFDYIIIDCPAGIGEMIDVCIPSADKAVLVTEPEFAASRDVDVTEKYLLEHGMKEIYIVANRVNLELMQQGFLPSLATLVDCYRGPLIGMIQEDDNIRISTNKGIPIVCKKGTYIERNLIEIIARIIK